MVEIRQIFGENGEMFAGFFAYFNPKAMTINL